MASYVAASTPGGSRDAASEQPRRPSATAASLFGLRDDSESVSGDPVDDPELEVATDQVDVSLRFMCVSRDALEKYLPTVVSISVGAYFGVGLRILLTEFTNRLSWDDGGLLRLLGGGFFLPNVIGCFVMGFTVRCKPLLRDRFSIYITGITTGFCGCCTTFASWDVGVAAKIVHGLIVTAVLMVGVQIASAFAGFRCGVHAAEALIAYLSAQSVPFPKPTIDAKQLQIDLDRTIQRIDQVNTHHCAEGVARRMATTKDALVAARDASKDLAMEITQDEHLQPSHEHKSPAWICVAFILFFWLWIPPFVGFDNYPSSRLFALTLAPFGAMLRYYLSLSNSKPQCKDFPWYTFIANVSASIFSCFILLIGSATTDYGGSAHRAYVFLGDGGILVGFCGSLSTVSTWINEIDGLSSRNIRAAYRYAAVSIGVSLLAAFIVLGLFAISSDKPLIV